MGSTTGAMACNVTPISKPSQLLLPITLILFVLSAATRLANLWLNGRFAAAVNSDLSCESYYRTLYQPYHIHLS